MGGVAFGLNLTYDLCGPKQANPPVLFFDGHARDSITRGLIRNQVFEALSTVGLNVLYYLFRHLTSSPIGTVLMPPPVPPDLSKRIGELWSYR